MQQNEACNYSSETEVEVDEVLRLMGHVRTEVAPHHAVPRGIVPKTEVEDICGKGTNSEEGRA